MTVRSVRDIIVNLLGRETISGAADKADKGLGKLDDRMKATAEDAKRLDVEIDRAERGLRDLAVQYARTQDAAERVDLTKSMRRQQAELRKLTKARDLLPDFDLMGREATNSMTRQAGTIWPKVFARIPLGPAGAAIGAGLAVGVLPPLLAAVGGATLSVGVAGAVVGGVVLAARDDRVKQAGRELGQSVMADLDQIGARFVQPTLDGIRVIRQGWQDIRGDVDGVAREAARFVEPLSRGLVGLLREFMPGLREGLSKAGPIVRELEHGLTRIGRSLGDLFRTVGDNADEGAAGLRWLFILVDEGVQLVGWLIDQFGDLLRVTLAVGDAAGEVASIWSWVPILGDHIQRSNGNIDEMIAALEAGGLAGLIAGDRVAGGMQRSGDAAADSAREVRNWAEVLEESRRRVMASEHAQLRFEEAIDRVAEAAREGARKGIDPNTEAGRANRRALLDLAAAANDAAADIRETTGSQELATEATERGRKRFLAAADAMGVEADEARNLANKLFGIPNIDRKVTVDTKGAMSQVEAYRRWLRSVNLDKTSTVYQRTVAERNTARGGHREFSRGGYVDGPGPKGVDSEWAMVAPGEGILTAAEVDKLGGRAGFERLRRVIGGGASSAGAAGAAGATAGGGGPLRVLVELVLRTPAGELVEVIRKEVKDLGGGDVQVAFGQGG